MENESSMFENEYLKQHLEASSSRREGAMDYLLPEASEQHYGEVNGFETKVGDTEIKITHQVEDVPAYGKAWVVKSLDLTKEDSNGQQQRLSILGLTENAPIIIIDPTRGGSGKSDPEHGIIFLSGDPLAPATILMLLHEIGHQAIYESLSELEKARQIKIREEFNKYQECSAGSNQVFLDEEAAEATLRNERMAWTFGLHELKPFIRGPKPILDVGYVKKFIHELCLQTYSDIIRASKMSQENLANEIATIDTSIDKELVA